MNKTIIKTFQTDQISNKLWTSYVNNFNQVFNKNFNLKHFINKYNSSDNGSFHSFLISKESNVVAAITIIPNNYLINGLKKNIGLVVDLFVLSEYRKDPLTILKLYIELKNLIVKNKVSSVIAVPNINSESYFINILKFKKIGNLNYWIFPINIGNIKFSNNKILNFLSQISSNLSITLNYFLLKLYNLPEKKNKIFLDLNSNFINKRFNSNYKIFKKNNLEIYYRIVNENGVNTVYLLYYIFKNKTNYISLWKAINHIKQNEKVDLILYVGSLAFFQLVLFKVPKLLEPKNLPFVFENINLDSVENSLLSNFKNWDFGLINYDVR